MISKYFDVNAPGHSIRCKLYCNDPRKIGRMVLVGHGFGGHKDNKAMERFAAAATSKYRDVAVMAFDLPCHGGDVKKKMQLSDCTVYIDLVLENIRQRFGVEDICAHATSFGGYLFLKYISEKGNPFRRIALRCPAVHMYDTLMAGIVTAGDLEKLEKGKEADVGFDRKIRITKQFLEELRENDISQWDFLDYAEDILIIHGTKDEIVPIDAVRDFADNNLIEFIPIDSADHRFQDRVRMDLAIKYTLEFFSF